MYSAWRESYETVCPGTYMIGKAEPHECEQCPFAGNCDEKAERPKYWYRCQGCKHMFESEDVGEVATCPLCSKAARKLYKVTG